MGSLVHVLRFEDGKSSGGQITDGIDVDFITIKEGQEEDIIYINFNDVETAPYFDISYSEAPYSMSFTISGARGLSAKEFFDTLKESKYIRDVYEVMTLDDSMVRFNIVFEKPIKFEVKEYKEPSQVTVSIAEDREKNSEGKIYSIRTASYGFGEQFAMLEEAFFGIDTLRTLKDEKGTFALEIGNYNTKEEAENRLSEIMSEKEEDMKAFDIKLYIEERSVNDNPKTIE